MFTLRRSHALLSKKKPIRAFGFYLALTGLGLLPQAWADFDYSCRCITNSGCLYETELLKLRISGPELTAQVIRYSEVNLSYLIDSKYSPGKSVNFFQYLPNPDKPESLPDGPFNLWIEKTLVQGGYRLSSGATGGFAMIPGPKPSAFVCSLQ